MNHTCKRGNTDTRFSGRENEPNALDDPSTCEEGMVPPPSITFIPSWSVYRVDPACCPCPHPNPSKLTVPSTSTVRFGLSESTFWKWWWWW